MIRPADRVIVALSVCGLCFMAGQEVAARRVEAPRPTCPPGFVEARYTATALICGYERRDHRFALERRRFLLSGTHH
jgi:hypothetical protein